MGFFSPSASYKEIPGLGQQLGPLQNFGSQFDLGAADYGQRQAKGLMKQMGQGNYEGLAGTFLSPIRDSYAVSQREGERSNMMGANALQQGAQPALMAAIGQEGRLKNQEGLGLALSNAVPQLYGQAQSAFGAGRQRQISELGLDLDARKAALQGKIGGNQLVTGPSIFGSIMQGLGGAAGMASGLGYQPFKQGCWIAEACYGVDDPRTHFLRYWLNNVWAVQSPIGFMFMWLYLRVGQRVARMVKRNRIAKAVARFVFDALLDKATREPQEAM